MSGIIITSSVSCCTPGKKNDRNIIYGPVEIMSNIPVILCVYMYYLIYEGALKREAHPSVLDNDKTRVRVYQRTSNMPYCNAS